MTAHSLDGTFLPMAPPTLPTDYRRRLAVETPEHVVLELEIAGVGSRALAAVVDAVIIGTSLLALVVLLLLTSRYVVPIGSAGDAVLGVALFLAIFGYYTLFEGLGGGRTPGKRVVGLRVVRDTGHAIGFGEAAVRNIVRLADALPPPYLLGAVLVAVHPRGKRLGDLAAGTVVVRDKPAEQRAETRAQPETTEPALAAPELTDDEWRVLARWAERSDTLDPVVQARVAASLAARFASRYPHRPADDADFLTDLHAAEQTRRRGALAGRAGGSAAGERFAARKEERWTEFERLLHRVAQHGLDALAADELPDFAARYREIAADLARARTYGAGPEVIARLDRAAAAGHNALYRDERRSVTRIWRVLAWECPAAVVLARRYVLLAFLVFTLPAVAGYTLLRERPETAASLLPDVMLRRAEAGVSRRAEGARYIELPLGERPALVSRLVTNNVRVAFACFAGGIFLGVGALAVLAFNGFAIGAAAGHFANAGLLGYLLEFIVGHGVLELFAIWVAGAAGFMLGKALVAPGDLSRADALAVTGRTAIRMVGTTVVLLVIAGLIEGLLSAGAQDVETRVTVSVVSALFLAAYLANGASAVAKERAHADRQRLDAAEPLGELGVHRVLAQKQQLSFGKHR